MLTHGLPTKSGDEVNVPSQMINVAGALTNTSRYYTYPGSLTTPPCTETVTWFVLHEYAQLSSEQFDAFRHILGNNFRPLQKRNGRTIRSTVGEDRRAMMLVTALASSRSIRNTARRQRGQRRINHVAG